MTIAMLTQAPLILALAGGFIVGGIATLLYHWVVRK